METITIDNIEKLSLGGIEEGTLVGYGCKEFNQVVRPGHFVDALVTEPLQFVCGLHVTSAKWQLLRKPDGSKFKISNARLIPDHAGLYVIDLSIGGGFHREIDVVAFPPAALDLLEYPMTFATERRKRLRAILADPRVTRENVIACLEGESPDPKFGLHGGLLGSPKGFNLRHYA